MTDKTRVSFSIGRSRGWNRRAALRPWLGALLALLLLDGGSASASGFLVARFGGEQGHPTTDDATAIYYNPAGLALRPGRLRLYVNGVLAYRLASYTRPEAAIDNKGTGTPDSGVAANSGKATMTNFIASPFLAVQSDLGVDNLGVAAGFYVPFGGQAKWDRNAAFEGSTMYPGAVDGVQRWSIIEGSIRSAYGTLAGAYQIPAAHLSIGVGLNLVISNVDTIIARNSTGSDDLVTANGDPLEGRSLVSVSNTTFSVGAGLIWQPHPRLHVGVSYQSQPGFGENTLTGTLKTKLGTGAVSTSDIHLLQTLPDVVRFGIRYRPRGSYGGEGGPFELRLFGEYVRWSAFTRQCFVAPTGKCAFKADGSEDQAAGGSSVILNLPRNWKDAFGVSIGGSWYPTKQLELFLGANYDSNAVPDSTMDATLMDMNKMALNIGARGTLVKDKLGLALTYSQVIYFSRDVGSQKGLFVPPSRSPDNQGKYTQSIGLAAITLEYLFL